MTAELGPLWEEVRWWTRPTDWFGSSYDEADSPCDHYWFHVWLVVEACGHECDGDGTTISSEVAWCTYLMTSAGMLMAYGVPIE